VCQLDPHKKDFGWMAFWELKPEVLGLLWLMLSGTRGRAAALLKVCMIGKAGCTPSELHPGICFTTEEKFG
jgi:hypothetical protein